MHAGSLVARVFSAYNVSLQSGKGEKFAVIPTVGFLAVALEYGVTV